MKLDFKIHFLSYLSALLFLVIGTYNAVVINSESSISGDVKFVKRLDEVYGVTVHGREVAATVTWQKLTQAKKVAKKMPREVIQTIKVSSSAPEALVENPPISEAAVQEDLTLSLTEVINQKKWQNGLHNAQFSGSLSANNGIIEELFVSLPNGEGLSVSFSEMIGNVFEYDMGGELYSGLMYQVDQYSYVVTLTNGPLEGTKLRFSNVTAEQEAQLLITQNNEQRDNFGNNADQYGNAYDINPRPEIQAQQIVQSDQQFQQQALESQLMMNQENQAL